jgi:hypothetical protein
MAWTDSEVVELMNVARDQADKREREYADELRAIIARLDGLLAELRNAG